MLNALTPSLEVPIVLVASGLGATEAVLEEADSSGNIRLRSQRFFSPGTAVSFSVTPQGGSKLQLDGRIAGYSIGAQRFVYQVQLKDAPPDIWRLPQPSDSGDDFERFDLEYRVLQTWRPGSGTNLSPTGLLMRAGQTLVEGMAVGVRFTLPSEVLEKRSHDALDGRLWDPGVREAAIAMLGRPFKSLDLRARIVCHCPVMGTIGDYGMEFCDVDAGTRAEIDRYCTALHYAAS